MTAEANDKKALIDGLQGDLAREYKAIIQYVIYSQAIDRAQYQTIASELEAHAHEELDHAIAIAKQIDYFGAYPTHQPVAVEVSEKNEDMLWFDLRAEDEGRGSYAPSRQHFQLQRNIGGIVPVEWSG